MNALNHNLIILQGATFDQKFVWKLMPDDVRAGATENAAPVDLTGCQARMQVREKVESQIALVDLTTENQGIALGGATGEIQIFISADDTAQMQWRRGYYDLEIVHSNGQVRRLLSGSVTVSPEVTRAQ